MKHKFYQLLQLSLLLVISSVAAMALPNSAIENYRSTVVRDEHGKVQKYSVLVSSVANPKNNSDFTEQYVRRVDEKYYVKGQIYVKTKVKTDNGKDNFLQAASSLTSALQAIGGNKITAYADAKQVEKNPGLKNYGLDRLYKIDIPKDKDPFEVCAELMSNPDVEYACPIAVAYKNAEKPNDEYLSQQWALQAMKVFDAWEYSKGGEDIKIAIVDSGTDHQHPDLAANIWTNPGDPINGLDDDGNGKVDDTHGWDFVANRDYESIFSGVFQEDNDPMNRANTHGTMTAGCAGAVTNNKIGVAGVAYNCRLIPVKIGSDLHQVEALFQTSEAMRYAAELGVDIINCSWGGYLYSPADQDLINYITLDKNIIVVAAAGNESNNNDEMPAYPASYRHVLSVGASDAQNRLAEFSNHGFVVTTYAPGVDILTTDAGGRLNVVPGTSFACPNVSGIVALVKAIHPNWGPKKLYHQIRSTSDRLSGKNNNPYEYFGVANALQAVTWNSPNSDVTVPGMSIEEVYINNDANNTTINSNAQFDLTFNLTNYLSATENLKVRAFSVDGVLDIENKQVTIESIDEDGSVVISYKAKLSEINPWSEGFAMVMLEYYGEGGKYSDYQMVKVPLKIESEAETFISDKTLPLTVTVSDAANTSTAWGAGINRAQQVYAVKFNVANNELSIHKIDGAPLASAVCAVDKENAYFGVLNPTNGYAAIMRTNNGGEDFADKNVSAITPKVNAIYFKDKSNGMFIGNPNSTTWGIATTSNGGYTWERIAKAPMASMNEDMAVNAHVRVNNTIYFGTSTGKIYRSNDFGKTWETKKSVSGRIFAMAFIDENVGLVLHLTNTAQLSLTTDGGKNWKVVESDLLRKGIRPINIYADYVGDAFVIVNSNGAIYESKDYCKTWKPIKKHRNFRVTSSAAYTNEDGEVAVYQFGGFHERVIYHSSKTVRKPEITCKEGAEVNLGNLDINKSKNVKINFTNTGNDIANITGYELKVVKGTKEEITIPKFSEASILPNEGTSLNVKFAPTTEGDKEAMLTLKYGNEKVEIKLIGSSKKVNEKGKLTVAEGNNLDFGEVEVGTKKEKALKLTNSSDVDVVVSNIRISPTGNDPNEVIVKGEKQVTIKAKSSHTFIFELNAATVGSKFGYVEIDNDGEVNPIKLQYTAKVIEKTSVKESNTFATAKVVPNPASNHCQLMLGENADKVQMLSIYSADGKLMLQIEPNFNNNILDINTSIFPAGQYNIMLQGNGITETVKLIVVK